MLFQKNIQVFESNFIVCDLLIYNNLFFLKVKHLQMSVFKPYFRYIFSTVSESLFSGSIVAFYSEDEHESSSLRS